MKTKEYFKSGTIGIIKGMFLFLPIVFIVQFSLAYFLGLNQEQILNHWSNGFLTGFGLLCLFGGFITQIDIDLKKEAKE